MAKKTTAYLAHTFYLRKFVKEVLTPKLHEVGIDTRNPFYEIDGTTKRQEVALADELEKTKTEKTNFGYPNVENWINMVRNRNKNIVKKDLGYIDKVDIVIAYLKNVSAGTTMEIFYAGVVLKKPVFLFSENEEICNHPWYNYACRYGKIVKSWDELIKVLARKYGKAK